MCFSAPLSAFGPVEMIPLYTIHAGVQERPVHHCYSSTASSIQLCFYCSGRVFGSLCWEMKLLPIRFQMLLLIKIWKYFSVFIISGKSPITTGWNTLCQSLLHVLQTPADAHCCTSLLTSSIHINESFRQRLGSETTDFQSRFYVIWHISAFPFLNNGLLEKFPPGCGSRESRSSTNGEA